MIFFVSLHKNSELSINMSEINEYRQELKNKIVNFAMGEFFKRGVKAVKMDEISQGLHVSKRTVYEIFGDKEELLLCGMKQQQEEVRREIQQYVYSGNHNVIDIVSYVYKMQMKHSEQVGTLFFEEIHKMPRVLEYMNKAHLQEHEERMRFFEAGVKEGLFRSDINFELMLEIAHVATQEIMHRQMYKDHPMQQIFDNWYLVIIRGFCTERGLKLLNQAIES